MPQKKTTKKTPTKRTVRTKTVAKRAPAAKRTATAKKTAVKKKATSKRTVAPKTKTRALVCSADDTCFWTTDGQVLAHLADLEMAFGSMNESVFLYHANTVKNDFSEWVEHILEDAALAASLRRCRKPQTAQKVVRKHLRDEYNHRI